MKARLHKVLASMGVASRRQAEGMIGRGEVLVNGRVAQIGESVDPDVDVIEIGGKNLLVHADKLYVALNKPRGYVSSTRRMGTDPTVMELLALDERIFPVGRLDKDTSGLLLLTNDGDWANLVTHPRYMIEKEYRAIVQGNLPDHVLERMRKGVELPGGSTTAPVGAKKVNRPSAANTLMFLTLMEGKKRQIRDMCQTLGHPVLSLERVRVGPVKLDDLKIGKWRHLDSEEVRGVREQAQRRVVRDPATRPSDCH